VSRAAVLVQGPECGEGDVWHHRDAAHGARLVRASDAACDGVAAYAPYKYKIPKHGIVGALGGSGLRHGRSDC
jgi:hypothetical protein